MSSYLVLESNDNDTVNFSHRGVDFTLRRMPDMQEYYVTQAEIQAERGLDPEKYSDMSPEDRADVTARALIGNVVTGMADLRIKCADGETRVVTFDGKSEVDKYLTQAEELLANNQSLRQAVFTEAMKLVGNAPRFTNIEEMPGNS